jgi:hypothetical protein
LGSFLIVRLAVMLFPAFAVLGVFPAGRGIVLGIARTVGAALVNAVIFGIGAAVAIRVLALILHPSSQLPAWLALVLMPLFGFMMWVALRPFRRLTHMVSPNSDPFGDATGSFGDSGRRTKRLVKRFATTAAASYTGNLAAAATAASADHHEREEQPTAPPDRAEARPGPMPLPIAVASTNSDTPSTDGMNALPSGDVPAAPTPPTALPTPDDPSRPPSETRPNDVTDSGGALHDAAPPGPTEETPLPPTEPEWYDGEEVYSIYRPSDDLKEPGGGSDSGADDAA